MQTFIRNTQYLSPKWRAYVTPFETGFHFGNGMVVTSLWELKTALLTLDDALITPHLGEDTHYLATWIRDVVGDDHLAELIEPLNQRWSVVVALERHMMRSLNLPVYVAKRWMRKTPTPFRFASGQEIYSVTDLQSVLSEISEETLAFHCERYPNDIASWLSSIVGDYFLSDALIEVSHKQHMQTIIDDHLHMLSQVIDD